MDNKVDKDEINNVNPKLEEKKKEFNLQKIKQKK